MEELLERTLVFAAFHHEGQTYHSPAGDAPYIVHPLRVAYDVLRQGGTEQQIAVALLHDVVEDTSATLDEVRYQFGEGIARCVDALTRRSTQTYRQYIEHVALFHDARVVKMADLQDNLAHDPPSNLRERYERAVKTLEEANNAVQGV